MESQASALRHHVSSLTLLHLRSHFNRRFCLFYLTNFIGTGICFDFTNLQNKLSQPYIFFQILSYFFIQKMSRGRYYGSYL